MSVESDASGSPLAQLARRQDGPTVDQIWSALSPGERQEALQCYLEGDKSSRELLIAVAATLPALRAFRRQTIKQLPDGRLIEIVAKSTRLSQGIVGDALLALHLTGRSDMLASFLDLLGIAHSRGVISDTASVATAIQGDRLSASVTKLLALYPARQVLIYLLALIAMDPGSWEALRPVVVAQADGGSR